MPATSGTFSGCAANKMDWNDNGCPVSFVIQFAKGVLLLRYAGNPGTGVTWAGVARHELGHILGFRHEHPWAPGAPCSEQQTYTAPNVDLTGRRLTAYDQVSVMHY